MSGCSFRVSWLRDVVRRQELNGVRSAGLNASYEKDIKIKMADIQKHCHGYLMDLVGAKTGNLRYKQITLTDVV